MLSIITIGLSVDKNSLLIAIHMNLYNQLKISNGFDLQKPQVFYTYCFIWEQMLTIFYPKFK